MYVIDQISRPHAALPGIDHVTLAASAEGLRQLSLWRQSIAPGAATPPHRHDCEEVVLCSAGTGELHIGGEVHRFGAHTTVLIPRHADHQILNVGDEPLEILAVFAATPVAVELPDGQPLELPWAS